ncbi:hypothetical protein [Saccharopolyspora mangrovi]|uniref:Uncharacterized protein n=1 Tax=Saccharopolyspora mangrovi TaxID=3082379 RepID=A0ABU6ABG3_9PSEU|nr:hypothetical protein [Saccharopolyspora sp. S2-29]MEB3368793.1 hypothetical protein [Saccharopolyspora sp. S2-29]
MTPPHPPHRQQPGYPQQGYPQQQGFPQQQPGYPQQPAHSQPQASYPQGYPQQLGHPQQPQSGGAGRVVGIVTAAIAIVAGIYVAIDGLDSLPGLLLCLTGGLALITGGVLLILRLWVSPFVLLGGSILLLANLIWDIVFRLMEMEPEYGDTIAEALLPFAGIATFLPGLVVTVLAFLPAVRKSLKPRAGGAFNQTPVQFGGYGYPPQQPGYPPQQPGYPPQQPGPQPPGGYPQQ